MGLGMGQSSLRLRNFLLSFAIISWIALCAGCGGTGSSVSSQLTGGGAAPTQPLSSQPTPVPQTSPAPAPTISLTTSTGSVVAGQLVTLTWTTTNAVSISFSP